MNEKNLNIDLRTNPAKNPRVDSLTSAFFWSQYILRHYFGENKFKKSQTKIEEKIYKKSAHLEDGPVLEVPSVSFSSFSPQMFKKNFLKKNFPVVIRGMAKDWDAVKKWTPDFFKKNFGNQIIPVRTNGKTLNSKQAALENLPLTKLIENLEEGGMYAGSALEDIFNHNPELRNDLNIEVLNRYMALNPLTKIKSTQLFMSGQASRAGLHCASGTNLFVMVYGKKKWLFIDPKHTKWVYPVIRNDMIYSSSLVDYRKSNEEIAADGYPLYRYVPKYEVTLEPGDVLFSPQWWWHAVDNEGITIAVATRTMNNPFLGNQVYALMNLLSPPVWKNMFQILKTGWGADKTGAQVIYGRKNETLTQKN